MNPQLLAFMADVAVNNIDKIVKLGEKGVKATDVLLKTNKIKQKNEKIKKEIEKCYFNIGKSIYENRSISRTDVKESIENINKYMDEIENNLSKIKEIEQEAKNEGVSERDFSVVKDVYKQINEQKDNLKIFNNKKVVKKTNAKKTPAKKGQVKQTKKKK